MKILFSTRGKFNYYKSNYSSIVFDVRRSETPINIPINIRIKLEDEKMSWWFIHSFWLTIAGDLLKNEDII